MHIVFLEPENPRNTGAIGRTCVVTNTILHLIRPLGFDTDDKSIKKSGLDYWDKLDVRYYDNFQDFLNKNNNPKIFMATTKAKKVYSDIAYDEDAYIMFGKESGGIPEEILIDYKETCVRIPMMENERSLNLATSASIILYEALRQNNFSNLEKYGELHNYSTSL